jgi:hypothetical protein
MLEKTLTETILTMQAFRANLPHTEVAGLSFAIEVLCISMLENLEDMAAQADETEEENN